MEKGVLITVLALMTAVALVGGVWGQKNSPPGAFSGTITKVDWGKKEIVVENSGGEMTFQWTDETRVYSIPVEKAGLDSKILMEGNSVTVLYREGGRNRVATRIDVKPSSVKTLKGLSFPFDCGAQVC